MLLRPLPFLLLILILPLSGCGDEERLNDVVETTDPAASAVFHDITSQSGVVANHVVVRTGIFAPQEIMGSGLAVFDANGDGHLDLLTLNAGTDATHGAANKFFLGVGDGTFSDATKASGLDDTGYGMGVAVGDVDNDGDVDCFITNDGPDALFLNQGDGTFKKAHPSDATSDSHWSTSAAFIDFDRDGDLDLFVSRYVKVDPTKSCGTSGRRDYCSPNSYQSLPDALFVNNGSGSFTDISEASGIGAVARNGLGVVVLDYDGDGWLDIVVANDQQANSLWINQKNGKFQDEGMLAGMAVNGQGSVEASMGVTLGDIDGDGDLDVFMTHLANQTNTLYMRDGEIGFQDTSRASGLGGPSVPFTGFGTGFADIDLDGDLDLLVVNGRVAKSDPIDGAEDGFWGDYAEQNLLFRYHDGRFTDDSKSAGMFARHLSISRGLAIADLDEDGRLDLVVTNTHGPTRIYRNTAQSTGHFLGIKALLQGNRTAEGARILVKTPSKDILRLQSTATSYLTAVDDWVHFGLGDADKVTSIEVTWPDGTHESVPADTVDQRITLVQGNGQNK
jgi:hypothetical protein